MQGDTLAPFLFILVIDQILRHLDADLGVTLDASNPAHPIRCPAFAYADDVILVSHSFEHAQEQLTAFEQSAKKWGLLLNTKKGKTELLLAAHPSLEPGLRTSLRSEKGEIGRTDAYKYLGWNVTDRGAKDWQADWRKRLKTAWYIIHKHDRIWLSNVSTMLKRRMFIALVCPVLQYAFWTYPRTKTTLTRTHVDTSKLLRYCLRMPIRALSPEEHHHTEDLYDNKTPFIAVSTTKSLLQQWGHWARHDPGAPVVAALTGTIHTKRKRGRAHLPSKMLMELTGLTPEELLARTQVRTAWKTTVEKATTLTGREIASIVMERRLGESFFDWEDRLSIWSKK